VSETLLTIAGDPKHLGAAIGFLAVLHTWGQSLHLHPHLHCVVPGGGMGPDGASWVGCRQSFFLPVRVLSRLFRIKFLIYLRKAFREGKLRFYGEMAGLAKPAAFEALCCEAARTEWVVYAKPPFGGPEQVLKYLARYTHRVAISNSRLLSIEGGRVTFKWKDYAGGNQTKSMTLDAVQFIRRFLLHILPTGFVRIRQFGFLSNRARGKKLALCRALLAAASAPTDAAVIANQDGKAEERERTQCPVCKTGHMIRIEIVQPARLAPLHQDSS
jgi:Putative transposase